MFFFLQHLLQSKDSEWLQELSAAALDASRRTEALLGHGSGTWLAPWRDGALRRFVADGLPRFLSLLQHASLLGQQELRSKFKFLLRSPHQHEFRETLARPERSRTDSWRTHIERHIETALRWNNREQCSARQQGICSEHEAHLESY